MALRVGIVNYLNSRPLAWGFLQGRYRGVLEAEYSPPAEVARRLASGHLDAGLLPSIEVERIPGLAVVPGTCVAATREVRSVLLVLGRPVEELRRVALDRNSRTSAALVEILLRDRWGLRPEFVQAEPSVSEMLADADAGLVIGDPALRVDRSAHRVLDLAAEWRRLTGHPFVFAVWAARQGAELPAGAALPDLAAYFDDSLAAGLADLDRLIDDAARGLELDPAEVREYLTRNLTFRLGPDERAGLAEFFRRAHAHGLIGEPRFPGLDEAFAVPQPSA